ncbi:hypothetical protein VD659_01350 [Herbiconiux sp. 11R-BC]|uniref:hypothetical protein n=1 Tax=Herbiconiux sp. 11R-BC TaxID=3111637 RepID=UPI003BFC4B57
MKIREVGPSMFPSVYGGMATGNEATQDILEVYLSEPDPDVEKQIRDLVGLPAEKLSFETARQNLSDAEALNKRVTADINDGKLEGVITWGVVRDVSVLIGLSDKTDERVEALREEYGQGVSVQTGLTPSTATSGRADDSPEWYGGDFVSNSTGTCTTAFPVKWQSNKYILTAGHCFGLTESVYNYAGWPINRGLNGYIGGITNHSFGNGVPDAELIAADGSRSIWDGGTLGSGLNSPVVGFSDPWNGAPMCLSGALDGQYCSFTASNVGLPVTVNYGSVTYTVSNTSLITGPSVQAIGPGDSGAPVFGSIGGSQLGFGILIASSNAGAVPCSNWSAQYAAAGVSRNCNSSGYITNIGAVLNMWGLSLD